MQSVTRMLIGAAMLAMVHGQGVITSAKGDSGESTALAGMNDPTKLPTNWEI